jgi:hypothetical protein
MLEKRSPAFVASPHGPLPFVPPFGRRPVGNGAEPGELAFVCAILSSFFVPWFVYSFVDDPGDPERVLNAPDEPLAAVHLRRHHDRLSATERTFLISASTSPLTFYAVTNVVAGREIALHDVLAGGDVVVREQSASQTVQPGSLLFSRVVTVSDTSIMSGCAPLVIPPRWHHSILDFRERFAGAKGRMLLPEAVRDLDFELRDLYFHIEDETWNPRLPELRNTESATHVYTPPRTITKFRPWPVLKPLVKPALDFLFRGVGIISPHVLTHKPKPRFEQIERRAKRVADGWSGRGHTWIVASSRAMRHAAAHQLV